jgi:hypothetical protein
VIYEKIAMRGIRRTRKREKECTCTAVESQVYGAIALELTRTVAEEEVMEEG